MVNAIAIIFCFKINEMNLKKHLKLNKKSFERR